MQKIGIFKICNETTQYTFWIKSRYGVFNARI